MKKILTLLAVLGLSLSLVACGEEIDYLTQEEFDQFQSQLQEDYLQKEDYTEYTPEITSDLESALGALNLNVVDAVADITLPTLQGVQVIWQSSHPQVINTNGEVNQPSFSTGAVEVTLTAILILDGQVAYKDFKVTVPALPETDVEKMEMALQTIGELLSEEVYTDHIELPAVVYGANVNWESSNTSNLSSEGNVLRPHFDQADAVITLTAYISAGSRFQLYQKTLTVPKMEFKQYGLLESGPFNVNQVNANNGAPLTFKLVTQEGHELYIPYSNVNADNILITSPYPMVYTPTFDGDKVPAAVNGLGNVAGSGFGVAFTIVDGVIDTIYDGIGNKIFNAENPAGVALPAGQNYLANIPIPDDGFVVVFHNSGSSIGNTLNGREFGRSILGVNTAALGKTVDLEGLGLEDVGVQLDGGVFWRGFVSLTVPFKYINPSPWKMFVDYAANGTTTSNFAFFQSLTITSDNAAPLADGTNVTGAYPLLFNGAYFDTYGGTGVNTGQGFTLAAVMSPEAEQTQIIQIQEQDREIILTNQFELTKVYDGIGGSIKEKGVAQVTLAGGDSGKNMAFNHDEFLVFWANNGVSYASDTHNRRVAADYFYAVENWVWGFTTITEDDMLAKGYNKYLFADILDQFEFVED